MRGDNNCGPMTEQAQPSILHRMAHREKPQVAEVPVTSSRAIRMAISRAANNAVGMAITVLSIGEEVLPLDETLSALGEDLSLLGIERSGNLAGLLAIDLQLRSAVIEVQTMGRVSQLTPDARPTTGTDTMLMKPFAAAFLAELVETTKRTDLDGWVDDVFLGERVVSTRAAGLALDDADFRVIRVSIDLGAGERHGELVMLLPALKTKAVVPVETVKDTNFDAHFRMEVTESKAVLDAVLHRFSLPLSVVTDLKLGQVIPLAGCTVGSVRILSQNGAVVGNARLGQMAGMRAVRIEQPVMGRISDLPAPKKAASRAASESEPMVQES